MLSKKKVSKARRSPLIKPKRLQPGGTVGIVAPAGKVDLSDLHRGIVHLERLGLKVILGKHLEQSHRYFAAKDPKRAEDLQAMFENKRVDAILCARGGWGSARLLPYLNLKMIARSPKIFVGASDITTLLIYFSRSLSWATFHGPMVSTQFGKTPGPEMDDCFMRLLAGEALTWRFPGTKTLRPGRGKGILTGGCLTLLCSTIGAPYEFEADGKILFLEDTDEPPYRIDRMLSYLKALKKFNRVRGVVFGQMPRCQPELLPEVILDVLGEFSFPILFGFPSGHGDATVTLPIGTAVELDGETGALRMCERAVTL